MPQSGNRYTTIFINGTAFTAGWAGSRLLGVGVRDGRIVAVAPDAELVAAGADEVVDLHGGLISPSFQDAHIHAVPGGIELLGCDLSSAGDAGETLAVIADFAASHPATSEDTAWIRGGGWTMAHFPGGTPTAAMLDRIVPDRPVALMNRDHHGMWVNSEALRRAGIDRDAPDPSSGRIERDADGNPTGMLHEGAAGLVEHHMPGHDSTTALAGLLRAQEDLFALGVTGWQDAYVGETGGVTDTLQTYLAALDSGDLRARVTAALWWERGRGVEQLAEHVRRRDLVAGLGRRELLRADSIKIMVDGVAESFTAALSEPYRDPCGHVTDNVGLTFFTPEELHTAIVAADRAGFQVHCHTLGDRATTLALDGVARIGRSRAPRPHHLAHLQMVAAADVPRFNELGVAANLQMLWAAADEAITELTIPFIAPDLVARTYPFRDLRDAHADLCAGSDWPVSSADPLEGIRVGVTRAEPGTPAGAPVDPRICPDQAIDLATAFAAYTDGSARINGHDDCGRLEQGFRADLVVLDRDPFSGAAEGLDETSVVSTWMDGVRVFGI